MLHCDGCKSQKSILRMGQCIGPACSISCATTKLWKSTVKIKQLYPIRIKMTINIKCCNKLTQLLDMPCNFWSLIYYLKNISLFSCQRVLNLRRKHLKMNWVSISNKIRFYSSSTCNFFHLIFHCVCQKLFALISTVNVGC